MSRNYVCIIVATVLFACNSFAQTTGSFLCVSSLEQAKNINVRERPEGSWQLLSFYILNDFNQPFNIKQIAIEGDAENTFPTGQKNMQPFREGLLQPTVFINQDNAPFVYGDQNSRIYAITSTILPGDSVQVLINARINHIFQSSEFVYTTTVTGKFANGADASVQIKTATRITDEPVSVSVTLRAGWSLFSFPVMPKEKNIFALMPGLERALYWLPQQKLYVPIEHYDDIRGLIKTGKGMWVHIEHDTTFSITGEPLHAVTIPVQREWNLIGSCFNTTGVFDPQHVITAQFAWNPNLWYYPTWVIEPQAAVWVYALENNFISIGGLPPTGKVSAKASSLTPPPPPWLITGIEDEESAEVPESFILNQNYPNPFNPSTVISFSLPKQAHVKLLVYTALGQQIAELKNEIMPTGQHSVILNTADYPITSGTYFYQLEVEGIPAKIKKMLLIK